MQKSQNHTIHQGFITWSPGRATQKKKIPGNKPQWCNTLENSLDGFTKTALRSWQWPLCQLIPLHQWPSQLSGPPSLTNKSKVDLQRLTTLTNALKRTELSIFISFLALYQFLEKGLSLSTNKSKVDLQRLTALTNALKTTELSIFISFLALSQLLEKRLSLPHDLPSTVSF